MQVDVVPTTGFQDDFDHQSVFWSVRPLPLSPGLLYSHRMRSPHACPLLLAAACALSTAAAPIKFSLPDDSYVSMIIRDAEGVVVRHPLTCHLLEKGRHSVQWDGRSNPIADKPGDPLPAGEYTWHAIRHSGIGLRLRGWAYHGPSDPWDISPTSYWGGDHGQPISAYADHENVYLGWSGAEAGKALICMGPDDNVKWAAGFHFNSAELIAADGDFVFYPSGSVLKRVSRDNGKPVNWPGTKSGEIEIHALLGDPTGELGMPSSLSQSAEGLDAHNGKLYLTHSVWTVHRHHILDWRRFLTQAKQGDAPIGSAVWARLPPKIRARAETWLASDMTEEKGLGKPNYYTPDVRDVALNTLRAVLFSAGVLPGTIGLSLDEITMVNRRAVSEEFEGVVTPVQSDFIAMIDIATGKLLKKIDIASPGRIVVVNDELAYLFSGRDRLIALNPETEETQIILLKQHNYGGLDVDSDGNIYIAYGAPHYQIFVYSPEGELLRKLGQRGGRVRFGPWKPDGMSVVPGLAVDSRGRAWAAEQDSTPKRVSVWDGQTGGFLKEFLGPTHYGASGAAINPLDPDLMIGEGCEFRIDPKTGRSEFLGIAVHEIPFGAARYCVANGGRLYLAGTFKRGTMQISVWERSGDAEYKYRAVIRQDRAHDRTVFWSDKNGDQAAQRSEIQAYPAILEIGGYNLWSLSMNTDLSFYGVDEKTRAGFRFAVSGFTSCGAPVWDVESPQTLPTLRAPLPSPDNRLVASCDYDNLFRCYDTASGKLRWTYPNAFHGVHGSHYAPGPTPGFIRGAFGFVGNATLPAPIGALWALNTNVGEWHLLTEDGYYLSPLFQTVEEKQKWPEPAVPGAVMDNAPAGLGGEDFGGSMIQGADGKIYVQAGKLAVWNLEVVGLDSVTVLGDGTVHLKSAASAAAQPSEVKLPELELHARKLTPTFVGKKLSDDFPSAQRIPYTRPGGADIVSTIAWDKKNLYLAWQVPDSTPWVNASEDAAYMYTLGDTVDFQLAAPWGNLRISIGDFGDKTTAVLYCDTIPPGTKATPRVFRSGTVDRFLVEHVSVIADAEIAVHKSENSYIVEAAIPYGNLGFTIKDRQTLRGDFGVTFSGRNGQDTVRRLYWSNKATGIVNDDVAELRLEPENWGTIRFTK